MGGVELRGRDAELVVRAAAALPTSGTAGPRHQADRAPAAPPQPESPAAASSTLLCVLGRWELRVDGTAVAAPDGVPGRALRVLALRRQIHVEELAELLWPDSDAASGRMRLRNVVSRIRASAGPIVERREELVCLAPQVEVDVELFTQLARAAHAAAELGDLAAAAETGERALALLRGPLLPDSPYADWALVARERAQRVHVGLLDLLAETAARRGDVDAALALLERAVETEPYEEQRYLRAADLCLEAGRRGAAAALLERARSVAEKLGVSPDPRHAELAVRMRRGPAAAAGA